VPASSSWTLEQDGDGREKRWGAAVSKTFPDYERFWVKHVVPLTYRPHSILMRSVIRPELQQLASANYAVFVHLAAAHQPLAAKQVFEDEHDIYDFYSRLYSVRESVVKFLAASRVVLREFGGVQINDDETRFKQHGAPGLWERFEEALDVRTKDYRGSQVHDWGFPVLNGRIPAREHLARWIEAEKTEARGKSRNRRKKKGVGAKSKGLGQLDAFLRAPDVERRLATEFVDAHDQAAEDLALVEAVVNEVWSMVMGELDAMKQLAAYERAQNEGRGTAPPSYPPTTTHTFAASAVYKPRV